MHHRVRVAADVLIDRSPLGGDLGIEWRRLVLWIGVTEEVPRRIDKGVHCVSLALGGTATLRTSRIHEFGDTLQRRFPRARKLGVVGKQYGQIFFRHWNHAAVVTIDNRDRRAPKALARDAPIANAISDGAPAKLFRGRIVGHFTHRALRKHATPLAAIDQHAIFGKGVLHVHRLIRARTDIDAFTLLPVHDGCNHLPNRQRVFFRELEIAFIMGRHAHHRTRTVVHQHVIGDPDWQQLSIEGIDGQASGVHAQLFFFFGCVRGLDRPRGFHLLRELHHVVFQR